MGLKPLRPSKAHHCNGTNYWHAGNALRMFNQALKGAILFPWPAKVLERISLFNVLLFCSGGNSYLLDNRWTPPLASLLALVPYSVINSIFKGKCRQAAPFQPP